jgi:hypothetical protein
MKKLNTDMWIQTVWYVTEDMSPPNTYHPEFNDTQLLYWCNVKAGTYWHWHAFGRWWERRSLSKYLEDESAQSAWLREVIDVMGLL